jgi:hypothetical protein
MAYMDYKYRKHYKNKNEGRVTSLICGDMKRERDALQQKRKLLLHNLDVDKATQKIYEIIRG